MSQAFIQKITEGIQGQAYRVDLKDHVIVFCHDGFRCEGELIGYCPEGLVVECNGGIAWLNSDWIGSVVKAPANSGPGGGREASVQPSPNGGNKDRLAEPGKDSMSKVFCNGTRQF